MADDDPCLVYITAGDAATAETLSKTLVEERLAACTNVLPGMQSFYWWEGAVQSDQEIVILAKTRADRVEALSARVRVLHPYDCPCIVKIVLDPQAGHGPFLDWVRDQTDPKGGRG